MKKIFLTSGLVLCMACPAFAGNPTGGSATTDIDANAETGSCVIGTLGTDQDNYETTFTAKWNENFNEITMDENTANGGLASPAITPDPLYAVNGISAVWTQKDNNNNFVDANKKVLNDTGVLSQIPSGKTVTFTTLDNNVAANTSPVQTSGTVTPAPRTFKGMYNAATGGTEMISASGQLTGGAAAASALNADTTWYAQYNCATPTLTDPVRAGYRFDGWTTDAAGQTPYTACIDDTVSTLYAQWTALPTTITFTCSAPATAGNRVPTMNGGENPTANEQTGIYSSSMSVDMDASASIGTNCALEGYEFRGWDCTDGALTYDAAGTQFDRPIHEGDTFYMKSASAVTCTAVWGSNTIYTVFDDNDATTPSVGGDASCQYGTSFNLPTAPSRTGYTFDGWEATQVQAHDGGPN